MIRAIVHPEEYEEYRGRFVRMAHRGTSTKDPDYARIQSNCTRILRGTSITQYLSKREFARTLVLRTLAKRVRRSMDSILELEAGMNNSLRRSRVESALETLGADHILSPEESRALRNTRRLQEGQTPRKLYNRVLSQLESYQESVASFTRFVHRDIDLADPDFAKIEDRCYRIQERLSKTCVGGKGRLHLVKAAQLLDALTEVAIYEEFFRENDGCQQASVLLGNTLEGSARADPLHDTYFRLKRTVEEGVTPAMLYDRYQKDILGE